MVEAVVEFDYKAQESDELTLRKGDIITDIRFEPDGWWEGCLARSSKRGWFPDNFVKVLAETESKSSDIPLRTTSGRRCKVLFSYAPANDDELELAVNDTIEILAEVEEGWWRGKLKNRIGVFPSNFVDEISSENSTEHRKATNRKTRNSMEEPTVNPSSLNHENRTSESDWSSHINSSSGSASTEPDVPLLPPKPMREMCRVLFPYSAVNEDELSLQEGDMITLISREGLDVGWWKGELRGKLGLFPDNFVEVIQQDLPTRPLRPPAKALTTTNRVRDAITKPATAAATTTSPTLVTQTTATTAQRKSLDMPNKTEEKSNAPGMSKKPVLPPPPLKKPQRSPSGSLNSSKQPPAMSPTAKEAPSVQIGTKTPNTPPCDSPTGSKRLPLTVLTAAIKQNSTSDAAALSPLDRDVADGLCLSSSRQAYSVASPPDNREGDVPGLDFDSVSRSAMLTHPTASRAKAPRRRPPSVISLKEFQEAQLSPPLMNGSAEPHLLEKQQTKAPWVEELKLSQAKKNSMQGAGRTRVMIGGTSPGNLTGAEGGPLMSLKVTTTTTAVTKPHVSGVTLRQTQGALVQARPQSMFGSSAERSTTTYRPMSTVTPEHDNNLVTVTARQWNDLNDKVLRLESTIIVQYDSFTKAVKELTAKLAEETERRLQMQLDIEKLTDLVTQV